MRDLIEALKECLDENGELHLRAIHVLTLSNILETAIETIQQQNKIIEAMIKESHEHQKTPEEG